MVINFNKEKMSFALHTKDLSYIFNVSKHGYLLHSYYGKRISDDALLGMQGYVRQVTFSPNPADDKEFSLDGVPQEFTGYNTGDYKLSSLKIKNLENEEASEIKYVSHEIIDGKPELLELPSLFAGDKKAKTLVLKCEDKYAKAEITLNYTIFEDTNAIIRSTKIKNIGNEKFNISKVASACVDFEMCDLEMLHLYGTWSKERNIERMDIPQGIHTISSGRGATGHQHNPLLVLLDSDANEDLGDVFGFNLVYSGNFSIEVEKDYFDGVRVVAGINEHGFDFEIAPNEEFQTPELVMVYSPNGIGEMSRTYHDLYLNNLMKSEFTHKKRPLLLNTWEAAYFDFNEQTIIDYAKSAKELGIELLVMDDGWFGKRNSDASSLGDWYVNEDKLKGGLPYVVEEVNKIGLEFGIWYEPEMISEDSELFRKNPHWCLHMNERPNCISRNQFVLNLSLKEVEDYLYNEMEKVLSSCNITYVKWDFNRNLTNVFAQNLPKEKQGEVYHRYMIGLYSLLERLTTRFKNILWEGCSGGGGRFDPAMLRYFPQIWTSDDTDAVERVQIQHGTSIAYPVSSNGSHVSDCPNHQTGRVTELKMRSVVAMSGSYGFELSPLKLTDEERNIVLEDIENYHKFYDVIHFGELYRLTDSFKNLYYNAVSHVAKDKSEVLVNFVITRGRCLKPIRVKLKGLDAKALYKNTKTGDEFYGDTLMNFGINFKDLKEYAAEMVHFVRV